MKVINCCGYGNTGCTAQTDLLGDYAGVIGALPPFHELGFLKCFYSFGGVMIAKNARGSHVPNKAELRTSLLGQDPQGQTKINEGGLMHLELRALMHRVYPDIYIQLVERVLAKLPDNFTELSYDDLVPYMNEAIDEYVRGLYECRSDEDIAKMGIKREDLLLGFKNDPPGSYPLFASFYSQGLTSAILRDPRDTTYDFNRHYKLGHTMDRVKAHCNHYNAQLNSARAHIKKNEERIRDHYFVHDFENLVQSAEYRERYVKRMIGDRKRIRFNFDAEKSASNIGHYVNMPKEFIDYIEENCMNNYTDYRAFLNERGMLFE